MRKIVKIERTFEIEGAVPEDLAYMEDLIRQLVGGTKLDTLIGLGDAWSVKVKEIESKGKSARPV